MRYVTSFHYTASIRYNLDPLGPNSARSDGIQNYSVPASIFEADVIRKTSVTDLSGLTNSDGQLSAIDLGDNCIKIIHLGRYIAGYTVGNFVLRRRVGGAVKHDFRPYIRRYTSTNEKFEYGYPHSNVLFNFYTSKTSFVQNLSFSSDVNHYVDQSLATLLLTSGFRRYIAEYTVANS